MFFFLEFLFFDTLHQEWRGIRFAYLSHIRL